MPANKASKGSSSKENNNNQESKVLRFLKAHWDVVGIVATFTVGYIAVSLLLPLCLFGGLTELNILCQQWFFTILGQIHSIFLIISIYRQFSNKMRWWRAVVWVPLLVWDIFSWVIFILFAV